MHSDHAQHRGQCFPVSFLTLSWCGVLLFLVCYSCIWSLPLRWSGYTICAAAAWVLFHVIVPVGVGKHVRSECPLATNFGINSRVVFLGGIGLFLIAGALWGGVKFYIAKCYFIYIDDIAQQKCIWAETYGGFRGVLFPSLFLWWYWLFVLLTGIF